MAISELRPSQEEVFAMDSQESDDCCSDDSDEDPTFDGVEETRLAFTKIAVKKPRPRVSVEIESGSDEDHDIEIPELDERDGKCFEIVEKLVKDGQFEKLKVDQCKVYLRKYGLRLTGNKDVLLGRIREHLEVINGGGEKKYPPSSFVLNCKGDACTGDVVMFEQNVYDMFNVAARSATTPPCGTRMVAGRIVKESYGAAKQQHTFTVEVLWSIGQKPLPPLHPLLIKGRNLYRLKTMRQRWADEEVRKKVLQEKHQRGHAARCERENRIQQREMRKNMRAKRTTKERKEHGPSDERNQQEIDPRRKGSAYWHTLEHQQQMNSVRPDVSNQQDSQNQVHRHVESDRPMISEHRNYARQALKPHNYELQTCHTVPQALKPPNYAFQAPQILQFYPKYHQYVLLNPSQVSLQQQQTQMVQRQQCRFYRRGRCYFGDNCKYMHD